MEKVVFAGTWQGYFHRRGLNGFQDFFQESRGRFVNRNSRRDVVRLALDAAEPEVFFMKRFHQPHLKDTLTSLRRFGRLMSQAAVEWHNANHLLQNGVGTYVPLCFGEQTVWGFESRSFLITEELDATCLLDVVLDRWSDLDRSAQEAIVIDMADLARRVHDLNVSLPDLCIWHIFMRPSGAGRELCVIDLHRMARNVRSAARKAEDLARLQWSMSSRYFDERLKDLLISTYAAGAGLDADALARTVRRSVARLDRRHPPDRYYKRAGPPPA